MSVVDEVRYRTRVDLRTHARVVLLVALLVTIVVGGVLGIAIGARRNATAYDRLIADGGGPDLLVTRGLSDHGFDVAHELPRVAAMPQVRGVSVLYRMMATSETPEGHPDFANWTFDVQAPGSAGYYHAVARPVLVGGRLPGTHASDEAVVNVEAARRYHLSPGSTLRIRVGSPSAPPDGYPVDLHIVGVARFPDEVLQAQNGLGSVVSLSSSFRVAHPEAGADPQLAIDLVNPDSDTVPVQRRIMDMPEGEKFGYATMVNRRSVVRLATCPVNSTMIVFVLVFGALGLLVLAQVVGRFQWSRRRELDVLSALGASSSTRLWTAMAVPAAGTAIGLVGAAILSLALAARFPIGIARRAELHPGFHINLAWTLVGLLVAFGVIGALLVAVTWHAVIAPRRVRRVVRVSRVAGWMRRVGMPLSAIYGARRALVASDDRTSSRRGMAGVALGMTGVVLALVFSANITALVHDRARFGWKWDELVKSDVGPTSDHLRGPMDSLEASPAVTGMLVVSPTALLMNGIRTPTLVSTPTAKPLHLEMVRGVEPTGTHQVALGGRTMRRLGVHLGDALRVGRPGTGKAVAATVVGEVVMPTAAVELMTDNTGLGIGAVVPAATADQLIHVQQTGIAVAYEPGTPKATRDATLRSFDSDVAAGDAFRLSGTQLPDDIIGLEAVGRFPVLLATVLGMLIVFGLGLSLFTSLPGRRRDLAVLKSLGFVRRQLAGIVVWEATISCTIAVVLGAVLGVAMGRAAWVVMAGDLALAPTTITPVVQVFGVAMGSVVLANLVALAPARAAARIPVSDVLSSE